jgi:uncharacterized protein
MKESPLIQQLKNLVRDRFIGEGADHDWFHIERVYNMAMHLQALEGGDAEVIACAALLHDISDHKLNGGKLNDGGRVSREILLELGQTETFAEEVARIVDGVSFKGAGVPDSVSGKELSIVRDADRLDAMGALGIARAFHFGGSRNRPFYVPDVLPAEHATFEAYANDKSHTINHFHEKLLLLQDRLQTDAAKKIGEKRHKLMQDFVDSFYREWNGTVDA